MAIVKYITDTGEEFELQKPQKFEIIEGEDFASRWKRKKLCEEPVKHFEESILDELTPWNVEKYAKDEFDLVEEDDVEEKDIVDFSDEEVEDQYFANLKLNLNIINSSFVSRFFKVIMKGDTQEIEKFLTEQEQKHKIV